MNVDGLKSDDEKNSVKNILIEKAVQQSRFLLVWNPGSRV